MNRLKTIRKQSGIKQKDVAAALGVSRCALWFYENGKRKLTFDMAVKLAKIYGVPIAVFEDGGVENDAEKTADNSTN